MDHFILSIDQGTTSCRAIVFDLDGKVIGVDQKEFTQHFPKPGWVEHDANEILETQIGCIKGAVNAAQVKSESIAAVGVTNQRETTVVWEREEAKPISGAIVWQCRRTQDLAEKLKTHAATFQKKTGLVPDAYFSGPKIKWTLDNVDGAADRAAKGDLAFGTIDSWLIRKLTIEGNHLTDPSNASRTMLFDINSLKWDDELLGLVGVPRNMMPRVVASNAFFGNTNKDLLGFSAPILAVLGDQQAALFGQACFEPGMFKCTYGTGSFILGNIGETVQHVNGLLTTVAWLLEGQKPIYALEGANFVSGAAIQWLRDALGIISSSEASEDLALSLATNDGVYLVPAFVGLGSPWWNSDVRGAIIGITRGTGKAHFARAALESMAYQIKDVAEAITKAGLIFSELRVDGGATKNDFLMQFQSSLLGIPVKRAQQVESTAWGVAALAAISAKLLSPEELNMNWRPGKEFRPKTDLAKEYIGWQSALAGALAASTGKTG
jgi:glycerol kinase